MMQHQIFSSYISTPNMSVLLLDDLPHIYWSSTVCIHLSCAVPNSIDAVWAGEYLHNLTSWALRDELRHIEKVLRVGGVFQASFPASRFSSDELFELFMPANDITNLGRKRSSVLPELKFDLCRVWYSGQNGNRVVNIVVEKKNETYFINHLGNSKLTDDYR